MHLVADAPPRPFTVVQLVRHRRVTALGVPAAAARGANEELPRPPKDVDRLPVSAPDDVSHPGTVRRASQTGDGVRGGFVVLVLVINSRGVLGRPRVELFG